MEWMLQNIGKKPALTPFSKNYQKLVSNVPFWDAKVFSKPDIAFMRAPVGASVPLRNIRTTFPPLEDLHHFTPYI